MCYPNWTQKGLGYVGVEDYSFKCHVEGCVANLKNQHQIINCTVKRARFSFPLKECMKKYKQLIDHPNEHVGKCYDVTNDK